MERVLSIFDQHRKLKKDNHRLEIDEDPVKSYPLLGKIYRTLNRLQESPEMEKIMTLEDIFLIEQQEEAAVARKQLEENRKKLEEAELKRAEAEKRNKEAEKEIARLRKLLEKKQKASDED